jgi:hypothetical protein
MSLLHSTSYTRNHEKNKDENSAVVFDLTKTPQFRVGLVIHRVADGFGARANNLYNYLELNRRVWTFYYLIFRQLTIILVSRTDSARDFDSLDKQNLG